MLLALSPTLASHPGGALLPSAVASFHAAPCWQQRPFPTHRRSLVSGEPRFHKARVVGVILPGACPQPPMHSPRPAASAGISLCHLPRGAPCVSSFALTGAARGLGGRAPAGEGTQVLRALSRWVVGAAVGQGGQVLSTWKALLELDGLPALGHGTQCPAGLPGSELKAPSFCTQQG